MNVADAEPPCGTRGLAEADAVHHAGEIYRKPRVAIRIVTHPNRVNGRAAPHIVGAISKWASVNGVPMQRGICGAVRDGITSRQSRTLGALEKAIILQERVGIEQVCVDVLQQIEGRLLGWVDRVLE